MALTEKQEKLPEGLKRAILAKQAKDAKKPTSKPPMPKPPMKKQPMPKPPMPKPPMKGKGKKY